MTEKRHYLDFESQVAELEEKIESLRQLTQGGMEIGSELKQLEVKASRLLQKTYADLTPWQTNLVARHPQRPYTLDYAAQLFDYREELAGDRAFAEDAAIVGGLARFRGRSVVWMGHQKGRTTNEKIRRNFGMPRPEGYRKAMRLMAMAERFSLPVLTFIDTPGAYPGIGAEERGQSEAIARNLAVLSDLKTPVVCTIIGEGGSGGALAIGVGDRVNMLQFSTYSVISPEGCASILWKDAAMAEQAAETLGIVAPRLKSLGLIDEVVPEPLGGAHRDHDEVAQTLGDLLAAQLEELTKLSHEKLLETRYRKIMSFGMYGEA